MSATIINQVTMRVVNEMMSDPQICKTLADYLKRLQAGYYEPFYQDTIVQKWIRREFTIYDAYAFSKVHAMICRGEIVAAWIGIGHKPVADKKVDQMNEMLKSLWYPFSAEFWGGTQDEDGMLNIAEPIKLDIIRADTGKRVVKEFSGRFPLEVGYMDAAKALYYLNAPQEDGRLARWPYGHDKICLLARVNPVDFSPLIKAIEEPTIPTQLKMWEWLGADHPSL